MTADTITANKKALEGVTQDEAIGFINTAMRNWSHVPKLDADDLRDLAEELQRFSERRYASTLESLQRENEAMKKDRYDLAYAITGGEDAPGLLNTVPTSDLVEIARNTHRTHSADIDRAMAAVAEVERLRERLQPFSRFAGVLFERNFNRTDSVAGMDDVDGVLHTISAGPFFDARTALSSTGDTHGN